MFEQLTDYVARLHDGRIEISWWIVSISVAWSVLVLCVTAKWDRRRR